MRIISELDEMTETARGWLAGGSVGFVPTRGNLHTGHLKLVQVARTECEICVVSILNIPPELIARKMSNSNSPSTHENEAALHAFDLTQDIQLLNAEKVDVVFVPRSDDFYPPDFSTFVRLSGPRAELFEGASFLEYFQQVATEITKLFQLVRPDIAYFGQKNVQQKAVILRLIRDLNMDVRLHIVPTVRESDGLPMSRSNALLTPLERHAAQILYHALLAGKASIENGESNPTVVEKVVAGVLSRDTMINVEYVAVRHPDTFHEVEKVGPGILLALAARIGNTRFIDNIQWTKDGLWLI